MPPSKTQALRIVSLHWGFHGGVAKYASLMKGIQEQGPFEIQYLCIRQSNWPLDIPAFAEIKPTEIRISSRLDLTWLPRLLSILKQHPPHVIMSHGYNAHFLAWIVRPFLTLRPTLLCSYHGPYHPTTKNREFIGPLFNRFTDFFIKHIASHTVTICHFCKNYLVNKGVPADKIRIIHNGIQDLTPDVTDRAGIRKEWNLQDSDLVLGIASRLELVKGLSYLVEAMSYLSPKYPHLKLIVIGTGTAESGLQKQVHQLKLETVIQFVGYRPDIGSCLQAFDIFVLPSLAECHSIALLEAMRAGKPIVATNVGGNTESVRHEQEALIIPPHDSTALAQAIEQLIASAGLRTELAKAARKRFITTFLVESMVTQTTEWFTHIASTVKNTSNTTPSSGGSSRVR